MRKIRDKKISLSEEDFINNVDNIELETKKLDPDAARTFKPVSLPLNEYEFTLLEKAAKKEGRSQKNFLRQALIERANLILK